MRNYVPHSISNGQKQGFSSPDASWFKGESIDFVKRRLLNSDAAIYQWMDRDTVQSLLNEHLSGENNRRLLVWSLLNVEEWCQLNLSDLH